LRRKSEKDKKLRPRKRLRDSVLRKKSAKDKNKSVLNLKNKRELRLRQLEPKN